MCQGRLKAIPADINPEESLLGEATRPEERASKEEDKQI
jgi:hypothetical protein